MNYARIARIGTIWFLVIMLIYAVELSWGFMGKLGEFVVCVNFGWFWLYVYVGPVVAEAMFVNREEIPIYPVYRDPVSCIMDVFSD